MLNNNEIWKQCTPMHEVSNFGNIRNIQTKKLLKLQTSTTGYFYITIRNFEGKARKHLKVHILVAKTFIQNPDCKKYVNHIDGNKKNNQVENLEWCSHKENMEHASKTSLIPHTPRTTGKKLGKSSNYHNVCWDSTRNCWTAGITVNKQCIGRKRFKDEKEAALFVNYLIDTYKLDRPKNFIV